MNDPNPSRFMVGPANSNKEPPTADPRPQFGVFDTKLPSGSAPMNIFTDFTKAVEFCSLLNKAQKEGTLWQPT